MIPLQRLQAVKRIITHDHCADGIASAMILKQALPHAAVDFMQYDSPAHKALMPEEGLLFCDFSPWLPKTKVETAVTAKDLEAEAAAQKRLQEFKTAGAIVLDHHSTQERVVKAFGELGVYADAKTQPGVSGAVLAFTEVWDPVCRVGLSPAAYKAHRPIVQAFARDAGVRDTWLTKDGQFQAGCEQREALLFWPVADLLSLPVPNWPEKLKIGASLWSRHLRDVREYLDKGARFVSDQKTRILMSAGLSQTSDAAEMNTKGDPAEHVDLIVGFQYVGAKVEGGQVIDLIFSTRSHTGYRCDLLAKAYGGGGHQAAAGFKVSVDPAAAENPYRTFMQFLDAFEQAPASKASLPNGI